MAVLIGHGFDFELCLPSFFQLRFEPKAGRGETCQPWAGLPAGF